MWPDLPHVFPLFGMLREALQCREEMARFVVECLALRPAQTDEKRIASSALPAYSDA